MERELERERRKERTYIGRMRERERKDRKGEERERKVRERKIICICKTIFSHLLLRMIVALLEIYKL